LDVLLCHLFEEVSKTGKSKSFDELPAAVVLGRIILAAGLPNEKQAK